MNPKDDNQSKGTHVIHTLKGDGTCTFKGCAYTSPLVEEQPTPTSENINLKPPKSRELESESIKSDELDAILNMYADRVAGAIDNELSQQEYNITKVALLKLLEDAYQDGMNATPPSVRLPHGNDSPSKIAFDFIPLDHRKHKERLEKRIEAHINTIATEARIDELIQMRRVGDAYARREDAHFEGLSGTYDNHILKRVADLTEPKNV